MSDHYAKQAGELNKNAKLTRRGVHDIRHGKYQGVSATQVARELHVSRALVCHVRAYRQWRREP